MNFVPEGTGWIEAICGSMYSGKTEELLRRIRLVLLAKRSVILLKPIIDNRYSEYEIVSHNQTKLPSQNVTSATDVWELAQGVDVIGIDEVHFLGAGIVGVCEKLANAGKRVIAAGLDQDYRGVPFDPMPQLMAVAEYVTKIHAICVKCGNPANRTHRVVEATDRIVVGGVGVYEARCRRCFKAAL